MFIAPIRLAQASGETAIGTGRCEAGNRPLRKPDRDDVDRCCVPMHAAADAPAPCSQCPPRCLRANQNVDAGRTNAASVRQQQHAGPFAGQGKPERNVLQVRQAASNTAAPLLASTSRRTIGCALIVANMVGCGFLETVYETAPEYQRRQAGLTVLSASRRGGVLPWRRCPPIDRRRADRADGGC